MDKGVHPLGHVQGGTHRSHREFSECHRVPPHSSAWAVLNRLALPQAPRRSVSVEKSYLDMQLGQIKPIKLTATRLPGSPSETETEKLLCSN